MARRYTFRSITREAFREKVGCALRQAQAERGPWQNPRNGAEIASRRNRELGRERARAVVELLDELSRQGFTSQRAQAAELNRRGLKTPRGGTWTRLYLRNCLRRIKGV